MTICNPPVTDPSMCFGKCLTHSGLPDHHPITIQIEQDLIPSHKWYGRQFGDETRTMRILSNPESSENFDD